MVALRKIGGRKLMGKGVGLWRDFDFDFDLRFELESDVEEHRI